MLSPSYFTRSFGMVSHTSRYVPEGVEVDDGVRYLYHRYLTLKKVTGQTRHKCLDTLTARLRIGTKEESSPERTG